MDKLELRISQLYVEDFFSMQQIADMLQISVSKVRYVLEKKNIKRRNVSEAIRLLNITKFKKGQFNIKKELSNKDQLLKIAGIMLYWGEGTKCGGSVVLSNSSPDLIKIFLKFLREICGVSNKRLRALLHIYSDQNEKMLKKYWISVTKIPEDQFSKSFSHQKGKRGSYKKYSSFGTISIRYSDKSLLKIINQWIIEYSRKL